jgi:hypothetical protein
VNLQIEVEGNLVNEPQRLRESIRKLFALARASVEEELNGQLSAPTDQPGVPGNGAGPPRSTKSQIRAIHALTRRHQIDLAGLLSERFGYGQPEDLSLNEASTLIDQLNSAPQTAGGRA